MTSWQLHCRQSDAANWVAASYPRPSKTVSGLRETMLLRNQSRLILFSIYTYNLLFKISRLYKNVS